MPEWERPLRSGPKRQTGRTDALIVGLLFGGDFGIDLLFIRVVEGESGLDLSKRERRTIRSDLLRSEPPVAFDRDRSHANARSGDNRPTAAQCRVARDQRADLCKGYRHLSPNIAKSCPRHDFGSTAQDTI
jgi:hypothetical protein